MDNNVIFSLKQTISYKLMKCNVINVRALVVIHHMCQLSPVAAGSIASKPVSTRTCHLPPGRPSRVRRCTGPACTVGAPRPRRCPSRALPPDSGGPTAPSPTAPPATREPRVRHRAVSDSSACHQRTQSEAQMWCQRRSSVRHRRGEVG